MKTSCLAFSMSLLMACVAPAASAQPAGPAAEYKIDSEYTSKSPDGATTIEQYFKTDKDDNYIWQFWAHRSDSMTLLGPEQEGYSADFRYPRFPLACPNAKDRLGRGHHVAVQTGPERFRRGDLKAVRRSGLSLLLQPSGVPKGQEAGLSYRLGPPERRRRELSMDR